MRSQQTRSSMWRTLALAIAFMASGFLLAACGGGSSGDSTLPGSTSGFSRGEIEGFGSIIVNGVHFEESSASVVFENGETGRELQEGMTVEVEGSFSNSASTGTATVVRVNDSLEGPIAGISVAGGMTRTFTVLGQNVIVEDGVTHFDDTGALLNMGNLANDQIVEVSGLPSADGTIMASFIDDQPAGGVLEVKGPVSNLGATTFTINALTVDFSGAQPDGTLANGLMVEVKGTAFDSATTTLTATSVELGPDDLSDDIAKVELEGFISALTSSTFMLNGQLVDYSGAAFLGGLDTDLAPGVKVEAEGPMVSGTLVALKIKFKESIRFEGNAINIDSLNGTFDIEGLGITVTMDATLTEGTLADGTDLKVRGRMSGSTLVATRIDDSAGDNAATRVILQGPATVSGDIVTVLGIAIDTTTITENSFDDSPGNESNFQIEDQSVTRVDFLAALANGDIVKARADLTPFAWDQVELEMEDD